MSTTRAEPAAPLQDGAAIPLGFLLLMGGLAALGPFSIDMYLPSLPKLVAYFHTDEASVQATLSAYFVGLAVGQLGFGPLIDRVGRRWPLILGLLLYVVASLGCALAPSVEVLTLMRGLQALGACAGMVVSRAVIRDRFSPRDMARVLSLVLLVMGVAPIVAPVVGSFVFEALGWQAIFVMLMVYGAVLAGSVWATLEESLPERSASVTVSGVVGGYWALLRLPGFMAYAVAGGVAQAGMFAYIASSSFVFVSVYGLSERQYAMVFGLNAMGLIGASQVNARLLRAYSPERILPWTLGAFLLAGLALVLCVQTGLGGVYGVAGPLLMALASLGFCFPNTTAAAMADVGKRAGMASALLGTLQFTFAGLSSFVAGRAFDGTAGPMAWVILSCGVLAVLALGVGAVAGAVGPGVEGR